MTIKVHVMVILTTGGAGFIGSHTCIELLDRGHEVIVVDNLHNSQIESLDRIFNITGKRVLFYHVDLRNKSSITKIFKSHTIDAVIHFAGYKAVGESVKIPLAYYDNNIIGTTVLLESMNEAGVKRLVFSSSCTVYGNTNSVPVKECAPLGAINPYGRTKLMIEQILCDVYASDSSWTIAILRYFNPAGAHPSGQIGENPNGVPNNLFPYAAQVATGKRDCLPVYGNDYPTPDGTCVRDYIHVVDLAKGHVHALDKLQHSNGVLAYNLGTGIGYSVLDVISAFSKVCGLSIPYKITHRRPGDVPVCFSDPSLAEKDLSWKAQKTLEDMCVDTWRWQTQNPNGFQQ